MRNYGIQNTTTIVSFPARQQAREGNPSAACRRGDDNLAGELIAIPNHQRPYDPPPIAFESVTIDPTVPARLPMGPFLSALLTGFALGMLTAWTLVH